jgi:hypothetical protein
LLLSTVIIIIIIVIIIIVIVIIMAVGLFFTRCPLLFSDMIFIQGPDVIFKVALMLLGSHRELILQCDTFEGVVDFLKTTLPEMAHVQMERIINQV